MFDLFRTRQKYVRIALGAILLLVALAMVITLIPGYGGPAGGNEEVLAEVGGEEITARQVRQELNQRLQGANYPPDQMAQMIPLVVNQMIAERVVAMQARQLGFQVTDAELANAIRRMIPQLFVDGQFAGTQAYAAMLARANLTIPEFENRMRTAVLQDLLTGVALQAVVVTPEEIRQEYVRRNQRAKIAYFTVTSDKLAEQEPIPEERLRQYYESMKAQFMEPEKRDFEIFLVEASAISAGMPVSEQDLRLAYSQERDRFMTPERARVRHILVLTAGKPASEKPKLRQKAEDLLKKLKAGADFAQLARENSEDPGSAQRGGEMDWIVRGQTVPNFERVAFSLEPKKLSDVVETEYGYHIIEVLERQKPQVQTFEQVKDQLAEEVRRQRAYDRMQSVGEEIRAAAVKGLAQAESLARRYNVRIVPVKGVGPGGFIPELGPDPSNAQILFQLPPKGVSPVLTAGEDKLAVVALTGVTPPRQQAYEEVKEQIRARMKYEAGQTKLNQLIAELPKMIASSGNDLEKLAKQFEAKVNTPPEFAANGNIEGFGPATAMADVFRKPVGSVVGPFPLGSMVAVAKILQRSEPDLAQLEAQKETLYKELRDAKADLQRELLVESLVRAYTAKGKVKINEKAIGLLSKSYLGK